MLYNIKDGHIVTSAEQLIIQDVVLATQLEIEAMLQQYGFEILLFKINYSNLFNKQLPTTDVTIDIILKNFKLTSGLQHYTDLRQAKWIATTKTNSIFEDNCAAMLKYLLPWMVEKQQTVL